MFVDFRDGRVFRSVVTNVDHISNPRTSSENSTMVTNTGGSYDKCI